MKNLEVIHDLGVRCECCSPLFSRKSGDGCGQLLDIYGLEGTSEYMFINAANNLKCGRFRGHSGPHVACVNQAIEGDSRVSGLWRAFHLSWED